MEIGIVGLPNVGKSSLFNALTRSNAPASNFPFTTIEPNIGIVDLPDERLDLLVDCFDSRKKTYNTVRFVDIAGLVSGASQGEGLGNKFLDHIRSVDAIIEVVRSFDDPQVVHISGAINPVGDIATINTELLLSDLEQLERAYKNLQERIKRQDKEAIRLGPIIVEALKLLGQGAPIRRDSQLSQRLKGFDLLTAKPLLYLINSDQRCYKKTIEQITESAKNERAEALVVSVKTELELTSSKLTPDEQKEYRSGLGITSGLSDVVKAGYRLLDLETFFTVGPKEARAWTITRGTKALQAAGKVHSDFERGFIRAEVYHFEDLMRYRSKKAIKDNGRLRSEGRDYIVRDGDVIEFLFNV